MAGVISSVPILKKAGDLLGFGTQDNTNRQALMMQREEQRKAKELSDAEQARADIQLKRRKARASQGTKGLLSFNRTNQQQDKLGI